MSVDLHPNRLFLRILYAIGAGILAGLFFGEAIAPLEFVANAFIRLLQVNVLPYLLGSLIASIGSRGTAEMKIISRYGVGVLLLVWGLTLLLVVLCPLALPPFRGAPVFLADEAPESIDWLELYVPANLFHALANNLIPAVVLFGILAGLALGQMTGEKKAVLLQALSAFNEAMARISRIILRLTPYGLFAITAVTAGELHADDVWRLQVWFHFYLGGALLLTLWLMPSLVGRFTDVSGIRFLEEMRGVIVTAAAAGDVLVVLPLIAESAKTLLIERGTPHDDAEQAVGVAVPLIYNLPHAGKILSLAFLPFAAWYSGATLGPQQVGLLITAGPMSLFGNINAAMPFLLDLLRLPADLFQLFSVSSVLNARFGSMAAAAHTGALGVVLAAAMLGRAKFSVRHLTRFVAVTAALMVVFVLGTRAVFTWVVRSEPSGMTTLSSFTLRPPLAEPVRASSAVSEPKPEPGRRLQEITARGALRVGYFDDAVPWSFVNARGDLVGHDIEAAHRLARQLGVRVEFVKLRRVSPQPSIDLAEGRADILMTGYIATVARAGQMELSKPYSLEHVGFLVRDHNRSRFATVQSLNRGDGMLVAVPAAEGAAETVRTLMPNAQTRSYQSVEEVLHDTEVTAVLTTLERAYYWSRVYPEFSAARPREVKAAALTVYGLPQGDVELRNLVDIWIDTRRASGEADEAYDYWVRGRALSARPPRWSVLANVLGWGRR